MSWVWVDGWVAVERSSGCRGDLCQTSFLGQLRLDVGALVNRGRNPVSGCTLQIAPWITL